MIDCIMLDKDKCLSECDTKGHLRCCIYCLDKQVCKECCELVKKGTVDYNIDVKGM